MQQWRMYPQHMRIYSQHSQYLKHNGIRHMSAMCQQLGAIQTNQEEPAHAARSNCITPRSPLDDTLPDAGLAPEFHIRTHIKPQAGRAGPPCIRLGVAQHDQLGAGARGNFLVARDLLERPSEGVSVRLGLQTLLEVLGEHRHRHRRCTSQPRDQLRWHQPPSS